MLKLTAMSIDAFPPAAHGAQSGHREIHLGRRRIAAPSTQAVRGNPGVSRFRVSDFIVRSESAPGPQCNSIRLMEEPALCCGV